METLHIKMTLKKLKKKLITNNYTTQRILIFILEIFTNLHIVFKFTT